MSKQGCAKGSVILTVVVLEVAALLTVDVFCLTLATMAFVFLLISEISE